MISRVPPSPPHTRVKTDCYLPESKVQNTPVTKVSALAAAVAAACATDARCNNRCCHCCHCCCHTAVTLPQPQHSRRTAAATSTSPPPSSAAAVPAAEVGIAVQQLCHRRPAVAAAGHARRHKGELQACQLGAPGCVLQVWAAGAAQALTQDVRHLCLCMLEGKFGGSEEERAGGEGRGVKGGKAAGSTE